MTMPCDDAGTSVVQRFEVFTGAGRRREWAAESKAAIVAESYSGKEMVCSVARRHGLSHFLDDGRVDLDSNTVERSIRLLALNRKNALFAGSDARTMAATTGP